METHATFRVDGERVVGTVHIPDAARTGTGFPFVLMLPGFLESRSEAGRLFTLASRFLAARGIGSVRIDFRGTGDSEGEHGRLTVAGMVSDASAGLAYVRDLPEADPERVSLLGVATGGMVAALAAGRERVHRLALWAPALPGDVLKYLPGGALGMPMPQVLGLPVSRHFLTELTRVDPLAAVATSGRATSVIHGGKDTVVAEASAQAYASAAGAPYAVIPGVGRAFERVEAREALFEATWQFLAGA